MDLRSLAFAALALGLACSDDVPDRPGDGAGDAGVSVDAGQDAGLSADDAGVMDGPDGSTGGSCPPSGPFGTALGDIAPDVTLLDCAGTEVSLHDALCEAEAGWVFVFAEWCPPCRTFARDDVENIWQSHREQGLQALVVVTADSSYDAPTAELCAEVQERYGLTMPVLYDPTGAFASALEVQSNAVDIVFSSGVEIEWKGRYDSADVDGQITAVLE